VGLSSDRATDEIKEAFPLSRDPASGRVARAEALLALRELADAHGRRRPGLTRAELAGALGRDGNAVVEKLASPNVRLIVQEERSDAFVYVLSHDRMAQVVREFVEHEKARRGLELDDRVVELRRFVSQRTELYVRSHDAAALNLTRQQYNLIDSSSKALLWEQGRVSWWNACRKLKEEQRRRTYGRWAVALILVLIGIGSFRLSANRRDVVRAELNRRLIEIVQSQNPQSSSIVHLAEAYPFDWAWNGMSVGRYSGAAEVFTNQALVGATPVPLEPERILRAIARVHKAFIESRAAFGSMSAVVEAIGLRSPALGVRAGELRTALRKDFIAAHSELSSPDRLFNRWITINAGVFAMGTGNLPVDSIEATPHRVRISAHSGQRDH
jgi:hypothetical protein